MCVNMSLCVFVRLGLCVCLCKVVFVRVSQCFDAQTPRHFSSIQSYVALLSFLIINLYTIKRFQFCVARQHILIFDRALAMYASVCVCVHLCTCVLVRATLCFDVETHSTLFFAVPCCITVTSSSHFFV